MEPENPLTAYRDHWPDAGREYRGSFTMSDPNRRKAMAKATKRRPTIRERFMMSNPTQPPASPPPAAPDATGAARTPAMSALRLCRCAPHDRRWNTTSHLCETCGEWCGYVTPADFAPPPAPPAATADAGAARQGEPAFAVGWDRDDGTFYMNAVAFSEEYAASQAATACEFGHKNARVVPVLVTVLPADAGADGEAGTDDGLYAGDAVSRVGCRLLAINDEFRVAFEERAAAELMRDDARKALAAAEAARAAAEGERDKLRSELLNERAFNEGYQEHIADLRDAMQPFISLVKETEGRIPAERLTFADWHKLSKAFNAAALAAAGDAGKDAK